MPPFFLQILLTGQMGILEIRLKYLICQVKTDIMEL